MSDTSNLPPLVSGGVFSVSSSIDITAPIDKVWSVLLAFSSYGEWNPFVRQQTVVDAKSKNALPDQTPKEGQRLIMKVHIPPTMDDSKSFQNTEELITHVDNANFRVAWKYATLPEWLLRAERWQTLSEAGPGKTKYETREVFGGILAYVIRMFMRKGLEEAFEGMATALKSRSEHLASASSGVFTVTASSLINATTANVWGVLLDFPSYHEWRSQTVVDSSHRPLDDQTPQVGSLLFLKVHIPPSFDDDVLYQTSDELVTILSSDNYTAAWRYHTLPDALLSAERIQTLTEIDGFVKYEAAETFGGVLAYTLEATLKDGLQASFEAQAQALKNRSESRSEQ
ncbi:hypothetical protein EW146_g2144 [Bondarzewia mesenterica]|uniref:Coenzyme Q-binding protein COQ10 START domain-containing protein n=1 Tax=Bondarzewia mesenterica TaxID=1095465 RepID=A0A4S4M1K0_9AGAM|nr:hypothetical protein EW146_g2144 [Bondarzewia mesenterica]